MDGLYRDVAIPVPEMAAPEYYDAQPAFLKNTMSRTRWGWRFDTPEKYQDMVKGYYRMISGIDMVVGRIRDELARLGLDGSTVIVYTSDNGYFLGERGYADKWLMYEPSIRVPLVVFDPRAPRESRGLVKRDLVLNIDLGPTLMDLAGVPIPSQAQGRSLKPLLGRRTPAWRSEIFCEELWDHPEIPRSECVRTERWKYIQYPGHPEYVELFDLAADPDEKRNLAGDPGHARVLAELRERCGRRIESPARRPGEIQMTGQLYRPLALLAVGVMLSGGRLLRPGRCVRPSGRTDRAGDLKCEYRPDPLGIDSPRPRLSWALASEGRRITKSAFLQRLRRDRARQVRPQLRRRHAGQRLVQSPAPADVGKAEPARGPAGRTALSDRPAAYRRQGRLSDDRRDRPGLAGPRRPGPAEQRLPGRGL